MIAPPVPSPGARHVCDRCRQSFEPLAGGRCESCGRLLCDWHLHGPARLLLGGGNLTRPHCPACRRTVPPDPSP